MHSGLEGRPHQPFSDLSREIRIVFVHDADRKIARFSRRSGRYGVDRNAKGLGDRNEHGRVRPDASRLLDHGTQDIVYSALSRWTLAV